MLHLVLTLVIAIVAWKIVWTIVGIVLHAIFKFASFLLSTAWVIITWPFVAVFEGLFKLFRRRAY